MKFQLLQFIGTVICNSSNTVWVDTLLYLFIHFFNFSRLLCSPFFIETKRPSGKVRPKGCSGRKIKKLKLSGESFPINHRMLGSIIQNLQ